MLNEVEILIFLVASSMKCSDEDKVFEQQLDEYISRGLKKRLHCIQWHLYQLEPTSRLVEDFKISEAQIKECNKHVPIQKVVEMQQTMERILGPLNVYTCGAVSENGANDLLKFLGKGAVIKYGNITEELRKSEKDKLKEYFKDVCFKTVNCVIKKFEDDPQGRFLTF
jgi:hypothetical protein